MSDPEIQQVSLYDLFQPRWRADPYPLYRRLRDESPVHADPNGNGWIVSRHADVVAVLDDARFSAARLGRIEDESRAEQVIRRTLSKQMLFLDGADHTRLRKLFAKAFTPRRLDTFRPRIEALAHRMLAAHAGRTIDFVGEFAVPLPVMVIALVLGVPMDAHAQLHDWSLAFGSVISGRVLSDAETARAEAGIAAFGAYFAELIRARRREPDDDMLSDLLAAEEAGDRLDEPELIANLILLLAAGHATTTHLLGNGLLALSREREQWRLLADDPAIAPAAVNELLRFDAPVQLTGRAALEDVELGGQRLPKGAYVYTLLGAANRDERHFASPDALDVRRPVSRVLSFGHGMHTCLGALLARIEAQIVFTSLAARYPGIEVDEQQARRTESLSFRGLRSLPVRLV
ncbi:cytochrome P450 [Burkholderia plantarii]|uniref:cytochrome P450 n=1 Tax=Burkholderia plantarii TaxID=41899 RepID=UPI0018DC8344|nr:cytochrome P450 [Burkholderia plantarii]MBI0331121.1 cytochrome P450 [Burkholderia plantarii]